MLDFIRAYRRYDPAAKSYFEIALLYPGPRAILLYRAANALYKIHLYFLARLVSEIGRSLTGIEIHPGASIGRRLVIDHGMGLVVGETAVIGDDCVLFHGVTLGGVRFDPVKRHPTIGDGVMIGAGAKVLGPIEVGAGARIGANAVVVKSVAPGQTMLGPTAAVHGQSR